MSGGRAMKSDKARERAMKSDVSDEIQAGLDEVACGGLVS